MFKKIIAVSILLILPVLTIAADENLTRPEAPSLEDRLARFDSKSAVFTVTTTADAGPGSLRDAIISANAAPGPDIIDFAIPGFGPHTIAPLSPLPPLSDPAGVFIDGLTQSGTFCAGSPGGAVLMIEIDGSSAGATPGLYLGSDNNVVQGLVINSFEQDGVLIEGGLLNPTANLNTIICCYIGTNPAGSIDEGNGTNLASLYGGVRIKNVPPGIVTDNLVSQNLISGNYAEGVTVWGPIVPGDVGHNIIADNFIGTNRSGAANLGNDHEGVNLVEGTHDNTVVNNKISGNGFNGVGIQGFDNVPFGPPIQTFRNTIENNNILGNSMYGVSIGTYGTTPWGCANQNSVINNVIADNGLAGVYVWEHSVNTSNGDENLISANNIHNNGGLGIDLQVIGVTPNDPSDPDVLANEGMNFPVIDSSKESAGVITIYGTLDTPTPDLCVVEMFLADVDPSGHGEGEQYLGSAIPNPAGDWQFVVGLGLGGDTVTATAIDPSANTSEFSRYAKVACPPSCCVLRGELNNDGNRDVADLTYLVNFMFGGGPPPICLPHGDINGDGFGIDISDLTGLVGWMFGGAPAPAPCC